MQDVNTKMFIMPRLCIRHHNMSYEYEKKTTNTGNKTKFFRKMGEENVEAI